MNTAKSKASPESYGTQKQKLDISLPTFQENNLLSERRDKAVVETRKMETRSTAKKKASFESYGILTRNQKQKLGVSLPTFQETNINSKRRRKIVVETELQEPTNYLDILPYVPLQMIYKYLSVEDIVNTCSVSSRTRDVAADKGTWKGKVLRMKNKKMIEKYINILRESSQLQAVYIGIGYFNYQKRIVEAMQYYLEDLRFLKVNCMEFDNISPLLEKFKNLEKIEAVISWVEIPNLLQALQHCSNLKELYLRDFYLSPFQDYNLASFREKVTKILSDSFPLLTSLYLESVLRLLKLENIVHILEEKKHQLVNLSFDLYEIADSEALDIISSCEGLNLDLTIGYNGLIFKLDKLKQLKSIKLTISLYDNSDFTDLLALLSGTPMPNVKDLKLFIYCCRRYMQGQFLEKLVMKFPMLQKLVFVGDPCENINDQLSNLGNLTELRSLRLGNLQCLTHCGLLHLSKCASLRELALSNMKLNKLSVENLKKCLTLKKITIDFTVSRQLSRQIRCVLKKMCFERNIILSVKNLHPFPSL